MKLDPTLRWLQQRLDLTEDADLGRLIAICPSLLSFNVKTNLEPTLNFFKECLGEEAGVSFAVKHPTTFTYSLEKRLKPRFEQVQQKGIEIDPGCVHRLAYMTEGRWNVSLDFQSEKLAKGKSEDSSLWLQLHWLL